MFGRGDPDHPNYIAVSEFTRGEYAVAFMKWEPSLREYVACEFAGVCKKLAIAWSYAKEWAAEEGVDVQ